MAFVENFPIMSSVHSRITIKTTSYCCNREKNTKRPTVCPSAAPPPIDREHAGSVLCFKKATILGRAARRLHPTITAGRDSPPDDRPPFSPNLVCGGGLSSPWAGWAAIGSGDPIAKTLSC